MAAGIGRELTLSYAGSVIAGCQTKSMSINRNPIDITNDDDAGVRSLLVDAGQVDIDLSVDGVTKDAILRAAALEPDTALGAVVLTFTDAATTQATLSGNVFISSYSENGTYNDAVKFSATLLFSGTVTYAAGT